MRFYHLPFLIAFFCITLPSFLAAAQPVESEVCIYGGTPAGIAAAVQAARMGKKVVLCEPGAHIGGMTSGGLGATDIGNKAAIGGIAREFYHRIARHYSTDEAWKLESRDDYFSKQVHQSKLTDIASADATMWTFEPHVAEAVFWQMLKEAKISVYLNHRLEAVSKTGASITNITMENGSAFRARMFIDASYEGDLMAKAGVRYAVGREPNSQYRETLNGICAETPKHQFGTAVDPYLKIGDPKSGLLPFIQHETPGSAGDGDKSVQAYNFRLCYTRNAENRLPHTPPSGYDSHQYELLARYLEAEVAAGRKPALKELWNPIAMPNAKTDINNNGGFSTDFIGANYDYPEASYSEREKLWQMHKNYTLGFIYFLATSPRVPTNIRSEIQSWGPAKDEFTDNDHWPYQLYVREARRMISDYVMTEHNCRGQAKAEDPAGLAAYTMDSHNCRRIVVDGSAKNEGDVQVGGFPPYPISYRSIIPKVGECDNLLVPVCLSATHIAYGSIRMEPVFMILGQTAATAAALAIDAKCSPQNLSYATLQAQLLNDSQVLEWKSPSIKTVAKPADLSSFQGIVMDDSEGIKTGEWVESKIAENRRVGTGYVHDNNSSKGKTAITFTPEIPKDGEYEIVLIYPPHGNRATHVPVKIVVAGLASDSIYEQTRVVNERKTDNSGLASLGKFHLPKGQKTSVTISNKGTDGYVVVDGIQFIPKAETSTQDSTINR